VTAVLVVYVALCFPRDRLGSQFERRFLAGFLVATAFSWALALALAERLPPAGAFAQCAGRCPRNAFQVVGTSASTTRAIGILANGITVIAFAVMAAVLLRKARSPSRLRRRAVTPLLLAFAALALSQAGFVALSHIFGAGYSAALRTIAAASALAIPVGLLVGQIRGNYFAAQGAGRMAATDEPLDPVGIERLISDALGDPSLALALWEPEPHGYVDVRGARVELPDDPAKRISTPFMRDGRPVAALIHDPAMDVDAGVVGGLVATSLLLLENIRLIEELRNSRARIVASVEHERLRLERDLHDGAQQRLLAIQLKLAQAKKRAAGLDLVDQLEAIELDAEKAVEELRTLAHGIYPTVLRERGLADALRSAAVTAPIPIQVMDEGIGRCPPAIEAAVYFCSLEAIQNAVKHAGPQARVTVSLERRPGEIEFAIGDDGIGMKTRAVADSVGLLSMKDRIGAVGGELEIVSSRGAGTRIRGLVPDDGPFFAGQRSEETSGEKAR
jgi:signal transduction histidine kinase